MNLKKSFDRWWKGYADIDPKVFHHPLAERVAWQPLVKGGSNFATHKLVKQHDGNLVFKPTIGFYALSTLSVLMSIGFLVGYGMLEHSSSNTSLGPYAVWGLLIFSSGVTLFFVRKVLIKIVFDVRNGVYWKGFKEPFDNSANSKRKHKLYIRDIAALQLIRERVRSGKSRYNSYELNVVLADATRYNVIDHGWLKKLRRNAATLAEELQVPLWDATVYE